MVSRRPRMLMLILIRPPMWCKALRQQRRRTVPLLPRTRWRLRFEVVVFFSLLSREIERMCGRSRWEVGCHRNGSARYKPLIMELHSSHQYALASQSDFWPISLVSVDAGLILICDLCFLVRSVFLLFFCRCDYNCDHNYLAAQNSNR